MQKILEYAEKNGYGTRISLGPAKYDSNINPGKFYAKIGFEPDPINISYMEECNARALREQKFAQENPDLPEEILNSLLNRKTFAQIDGRFVTDESHGYQVFLTHPEVLRNYQLWFINFCNVEFYA